jgi:hypothetical protein
MAFLIDEQKLINDNIFKYENRLNSQLSRFLDKSPVFVTYFHINVNETTVDDGFRDIESIIGARSPLRFQKIENFPIYGLEPVILAIQDMEQGLDTDYSGDAIILPNTIKPLQNDFFMITHVKGSFIFRVTEIQYDSIRPDNYYKLSFRLEYLDENKEEELNNQVEEKYTCILQNIGSENTCIIREDYMNQISLLDDLYSDMLSTYKALFYNERYNCFLGESSTMAGYKIYDPLQMVFFNTHKLLNKKSDYSTIILTEGFEDKKRKIKYEHSIYRFFERRDVKLVTTFPFNIFNANDRKDSSFARWNDKSIVVVDNPTNNSMITKYEMLPIEVVNAFKFNAPQDSIYLELMQKFVRNEPLGIYDIPLNLNEELLKLDANEEVFFFTPILLYIIQVVVNDFLKEKK